MVDFPVTKKVHVIVLGDVGRSPRMLFHAWSFAQEGWSVTMTGYKGAQPHPMIAEHPHVAFTYIPETPEVLNKLWPHVLGFMMKLVFLFVIVMWHLLVSCSRSDIYIVQNPPAIPTLLCLWLVKLIRRPNLIIIDWHNYGASHWAHKFGFQHPLTKFYWLLDTQFAAKFLPASPQVLHLCVTDALRQDLEHSWGLQASVLHDRPGPTFPVNLSPMSVGDSHELFCQLSVEYFEFGRIGFTSGTTDFARQFTTTDGSEVNSSVSTSEDDDSVPLSYDAVEKNDAEMTCFTKVERDKNGDCVVWREDRPALIISSTSWTPDERFDMLIDALDIYNARYLQSMMSRGESAESTCHSEGSQLPRLVCVVTGKGPLKKYYERLAASRNWSGIKFVTPWLKAIDYPKLLSSADLGISLHASSSGLDLPMKVVDMFACGLPVCALSFPALPELVQHGVNGQVFNDAVSLCDCLCTLLSSFSVIAHKPRELLGNELVKYRNVLSRFKDFGWHDNWSRVVLPKCADIS